MKPSLLQKPILSVPLHLDPNRYFLCLLGPLAFGLSLGIQATVAAFLTLGPASNPGLAEQLTELGKAVAVPEHDLLIYVAGAVLTLTATGFTVWYWRAKLAGLEAAKAAEIMVSSALVQGVMAVSSLLVLLLLVCSDWFSRDVVSVQSAARPLLSLSDGVLLLLPGAVALVCTVLELECSTAPVARLDQWRRRVGRILLYAVPLFVILIVGVPPGRWRHLAGQIFGTDACHHLNFFFMGPALAFAHGRAFASEVYSQYGIGWPLLAASFCHWSALTYGNLVGLEIMYGCVYYLALFFLVRKCFRQEIWAGFAVLLAIYWQVFSGMSPNELIWVFPSSTPMRHPMDVWFFFALLMHQRSGRIVWAVVAGMASALGVFFETETGAYLLVTFLVYSVLQAGLAAGERRAVGNRSWLLAPVAFYCAALLVLLPLLLYASRGTLFTAAFWRGWGEALVAYAGQGVGALPIAALPDSPLILFVIMITSYLAAVVYAGVRALHGKASQGEVLLATLAAYGLALLLLFVNRSHPYNLCHAAIPFAVLLTALIFQGHEHLQRRAPRSLLPCALFVGLLLLLLTKAEFRRYPSFLASIFSPAPPEGVSLRSNPDDIGGLPPLYEGFANDFREICRAIQPLASDGKGVAIFDLNDTILYSAANVRPWSRYASLFHLALTQPALEGIRDDLIARRPKYVVIRGRNAARPPNWDFIWAPLYEVVTNRYVLYQTVGPYEIWRHGPQL